MQVASCEGKFKYSTNAKARDSARRSNRRNDKVKMAAYKCKYCGWWHTGSSIKRGLRWATRKR